MNLHNLPIFPLFPQGTGLVAVVGTGTGIGKTHLTTSLARAAAAAGRSVAAYKPVESGVDPVAEDLEALQAASTVRPAILWEGAAAPKTYVPPVSPHRAARLAGDLPDLDAIVAALTAARRDHAVLLELPGGLYSPLVDGVLPGDFLRRVAPDRTLLVAPDRLGVLHDLGATTRAAAADGIPLDALFLSAPATADASTGTNALELAAVTTLPLAASLPRAPVATLAALLRPLF